MKKTALLLLLLVVAGWFFAYRRTVHIDAVMNGIEHQPPYPVPPEVRALHDRLFIADMHADALLWGRGLLRRADRGQLDLPRMLEANEALQFFTVVTQSPRNLNIEHNSGDSDELTPAYIVRFMPPRTWFSHTERALYQVQELEDAARGSSGQLTVIRTRADLEAFLARRATNPHVAAGLLGIEGAHALDGKLANLDRLDRAGFRMIGMAHFFDNEFAGSAHGVEKYGLTPQGRELVRQMEQRKILVDLAHASPKTIDDVLAITTRPVVVSHTGVRGTCDNQRNLSDDQLRRIAATGGVIGIGFWDVATCGHDAAAIARTIRHAVEVAGIDHVALGSDFDGGTVQPFDVTGLPLVTQALMQEGFSEDEITKIMGGNVVRLLRQTLP